MDSAKTWKLIVPVFLVALAVNIGMGFKLGMSRPMTSDAEYFLDIAGNVAEGRGYVLDHGYWPGAPTATRLPGWPLLVAAFLRVSHTADPNVVMRLICLVINSLAAALLALLTKRLLGRELLAYAVGLLYVIHPTGLYMAYEGMSEPLFLVTVTTGVLLLLGATNRARLIGMLCMGVACLVRAQFILWAFFALPMATVWYWFRRECPSRKQALLVVTGVALCLLPSVLWAVRNQRVSGDFPVISTIKGAALYGGNNAVVADTLEWWGYWVFPDNIPGETRMATLAEHMSEFEVEKYHNQRGWEYILSHKRGMPRLWLGKLVRAYVPVPWKPSLGTWSVSAYRWLLYAAVPIGLFLRGRRLSPVYRLTVAAMVLANVAAVVVFWGCARFAFAMEPFLLPLAALLVMRGEPGRRTEPFRQKTTQGRVTTE